MPFLLNFCFLEWLEMTFFLVTQLNLEKYSHSSCDESIWSFEPPWLFYFLSLDFSRGQRTSTNSPIQCFIISECHRYRYQNLCCGCFGFTNLHMRHASQLLVPNVLVYLQKLFAICKTVSPWRMSMCYLHWSHICLCITLWACLLCEIFLYKCVLPVISVICLVLIL